jgi:hypothetical protein
MEPAKSNFFIKKSAAKTAARRRGGEFGVLAEYLTLGGESIILLA